MVRSHLEELPAKGCVLKELWYERGSGDIASLKLKAEIDDRCEAAFLLMSLLELSKCILSSPRR